MNDDLLSKITDIENAISNLEKEKRKLEDKFFSEKIKTGDEFYSSLIGKCFFEKDCPNHIYLPLKYNGFDKEQYKFVIECRHLYYDSEYIMCNTIDLRSLDPRDFKRLYEVDGKDKFINSTKKAISYFCELFILYTHNVCW